MYSKNFLICCLLVFMNACSATLISPQEEYVRAKAAGDQLVGEYGSLGVLEVNLYLADLSRRLTAALPQLPPEYPVYEVVVLNADAPLAFSPGAGFVFISRGLVRTMRSEGALAFVIAHEIAHQELRHTRLPDFEAQEVDRDLEFEADRYAATTIARAGYDPFEGIRAIEQATAGRKDLRADHGAIAFTTDRTKRLKEFLSRGGFSRMGSPLPQRDFLRMKGALG